MSNGNVYESFRTVLVLNLCTVTQDPTLLQDIMAMVDMTMMDFEIDRKCMDIIPADRPTEVINYYLSARTLSGLSPATLKQYNYKLIDFFDTVKKSYADITPADVRNYLCLCKINRNASYAYLDNIRITLNTFFQWLVDKEFLVRNPCANIDKFKYQQKIREPLTTLNLEDLRWHCVDEREKALIDFLYSTGCRISECAGVLISDINWEANAVHLRHCKGGKERFVYFNDEAKISLRAYIEHRGHISPALWTSLKNPHQQLKSHALENIIKKVGERTGVHAYPHKLRHTFASVGLKNGMQLEELQELMGHVNPQTTLIYAKQNKEILRMEHQKAFS